MNYEGGIIMDFLDRINEKYIKYRKFFEIPLLVIIVMILATKLATRGPGYVVNTYYSIALQVVYVIALTIFSFYIHELGHYLAIKKLFPKADSEFLWTTYCYVPIPHKVRTKTLNGVLTDRKAIFVLISGPILGFIPIILSYHILSSSYFLFLIISELLACKSDFKKIFATFKERRQGTAA